MVTKNVSCSNIRLAQSASNATIATAMTPCSTMNHEPVREASAPRQAKQP